jgi:hypothetical protein
VVTVIFMKKAGLLSLLLPVALGDDDGLNNAGRSSVSRKMNRFEFNGTRLYVRHVPLWEINFLIGPFSVSILIRNFLNPFPRTADCHVKRCKASSSIKICEICFDY